jgi:hypothetical protein
MTMNGGTSLRAEGNISRLAVSSMLASLLIPHADSAMIVICVAPLSPHFSGQIPGQTRNRTDRSGIDRVRAHRQIGLRK